MPDDDAIIVTGYRINWGGGGAGSSNFYSSEAGPTPYPQLEPGAGGAPVPEAPTDLDPPQVAAEIIDPANKAAVQAAADRLTTVVHDLTDKISHLSNSDILMFRNGQSMTGAEIKSL